MSEGVVSWQRKLWTIIKVADGKVLAACDLNLSTKGFGGGGKHLCCGIRRERCARATCTDFSTCGDVFLFDRQGHQGECCRDLPAFWDHESPLSLHTRQGRTSGGGSGTVGKTIEDREVSDRHIKTIGCRGKLGICEGNLGIMIGEGFVGNPVGIGSADVSNGIDVGTGCTTRIRRRDAGHGDT